MKTYALVNIETQKVVLEKGGPFDGDTLEEAMQEVAETVPEMVPETWPAEMAQASVQAKFKHLGWQLVPLTSDHEHQYAEEAGT